MNSILQNLDPPDLEYAMNANHAAFWTALAEHASDITEHYRDAKIGWLSSVTNISYPYNLVMPLALEKVDQNEAAAVIAASIERAKNRAVDTECWLSPSAMNAGLGQILEAQGYKQGGGPAGMAVDLAHLNENIPRPANFEIRHVENADLLEHWINIFLESWSAPETMRPLFVESFGGYGLSADLDMRHYVGYCDGKPVSASSLFLAEGVAGIYAVETVPQSRGKGFGALITLAPLVEVREKGYRVGILQASDMGYPVYKRLGFREIFRYSVFRWSAPTL